MGSFPWYFGPKVAQKSYWVHIEANGSHPGRPERPKGRKPDFDHNDIVMTANNAGFGWQGRAEKLPKMSCQSRQNWPLGAIGPIPDDFGPILVPNNETWKVLEKIRIFGIKKITVTKIRAKWPSNEPALFAVTPSLFSVAPQIRL